MPRPIVLGNGELLVNLDEDLSIRDLYYPYVGQLNHIGGHKCRIGVWTSDHGFAWLGDQWERRLQYQPGTLVTDIYFKSRDLGVELQFVQAVAKTCNTFLQQVRVTSLTPFAREVRLFFAYDFRIDESDIGDTAFYNPFLNALIHYKRSSYLLISGYVGADSKLSTRGIAQYACGIKEFQGAEGAWRDAEDGVLSGSAIAQGSVDSVIGFHLNLAEHGSDTLRLWLGASDSLPNVSLLHKRVQELGFDHLLAVTGAEDRAWAHRGIGGANELPEEIAILFQQSLLLVRSHMDKRGAIIASADSDIMQTARAHYAYTWPRDGALVAYAMDRAGDTALTTAFFRFCADALDDINPQNFWSTGSALMHKYCPDRTLGSSWHPWALDHVAPEPPIQEDGTALVVWSCIHHCETSNNEAFTKEMYDRVICPAADFLAAHRDTPGGLPAPSWDIWEERRGVHVYTVSAVIAALTAASRMAAGRGDTHRSAQYHRASSEILVAFETHFWNSDLNRFARMVTHTPDGHYTQDMTIDSSAFGVFGYGALPASHPKVRATMEAIGRTLWVKTGVGGLARYERDYYFRVTEEFDKVTGNPWIICTLWLAEWAISTAVTRDDLRPALDLLRWAARSAMSTGVLPEQVHPHTSEPLSVAPLTWSHAQFITTTLNYLKRQSEFESTTV